MQQVAERLADLVNVDQNEIRLGAVHRAPHADGVVVAGPFTFLVEWKGVGSAGPVAAAIERVRHYAKDIDGAVVPLVAVPFMGETGRKRCAQAEIAWMDLSGNARIIAPGLRIMVEGKPNRYKRRGRPSSVFAPKSSRITRWLLMHPAEPVTQREIARATNMDEGFVSRIVSELEANALVIRSGLDGSDGGYGDGSGDGWGDGSGGGYGDGSGDGWGDGRRGRPPLRVRDPSLLLDAWQEVYNFSKHHLIRGNVAARSGATLLRQLTDVLGQASVPYAATGLAAAWMLDRFAGFRITTLYLAQEPLPELLAALSFREDARGANVWLVVPNDEGVFHGASDRDGVRCVHPVQIYLDLHAHPERADEAAQRLRAGHLTWSTDV